MNCSTKKPSIYSKIKCVNYLTKREISKLNTRYYSSGLFMKQIIVDKYGKEIKKENPDKNILGHKRDRRGFNSLDTFLYNYYGKEKFVILNQSYEKEEKLFNFDPEDKIITRKCLTQLKDSLNTIKIDCEYMANKNSKIETDEYKLVVLKYISELKKYLTDDQYSYLKNKWKNELLKVRGTDLFNFEKINDITNWKVSILKCFKSEMVLYGICNIYDGVIKGSKFVNEKKDKNIFTIGNEKENVEDKKIDESQDVNAESSDDELTEKTFDGNMINS